MSGSEVFEMIERYKVLGIITARAGSKGLPGKNILPLCGKPLIAWSILAARQSTYLDSLVVTTDSQDIADISVQYGAEVPFLRPAELATDTSTSFSVIKHSIQELKRKSALFDIVVLIEPTSPLREAQDIDHALEKMLEYKADSIVSMGIVESGRTSI